MTSCVILVGLPGSGKSTVGRQLGRRLGLPFFDSDTVIEERLGEPIRCFFEREGEDAFRDVEQAVLADLLAPGCAPRVLATGGGAVLRAANRERMASVQAVVVYLRVSPEHLVRRLRGDDKRPLLQVSDPLARLRALYEVRDPLYRQVADFTLEAHASSVALLVSRVAMQLELC